MKVISFENWSFEVDFTGGSIASLCLGGKERVVGRAPLFRFRLRDQKGDAIVFTAHDALRCETFEDGAAFFDFCVEETKELLRDVSVHVSVKAVSEEAAWQINVRNSNADYAVEWVDFPLVRLPKLVKNDAAGGTVLMPYNEGVLISDSDLRESTGFLYCDPEYPSKGNYRIFPNMISSQMMAYLWEDVGLYVGAHDARRGVKGIDFYPDDEGVTLQLRLFCGVDFGEDFLPDYPVVWALTDGRWESAAERYREWFASALPKGVKKIKDNRSLPLWYEDAPLIVSYPVRGIHDTDEMKPNALFPYVNALPLIDEVKTATNAKILTLLMHWEGTAPWAPPYVWPPYGGEDALNVFRDALHAEGDLLGVYCSGFGYTKQSKLIADYNMEAEYEEKGLSDGMCASPAGDVPRSKICTAQRSGYDICPASEIGRALLDEAYAPLFESGLDYVQILDQNHGGGQYFCYSRQHGHPPVPGAWMTERMQEMLSDWNTRAPGMLFGCESAAAEPFIGNLAFSDNRFELNYGIGTPVPLYAYLYHEYLRNFMGNQVSCPFSTAHDTLCHRIAYSFAAGDCMTLVFHPDGKLMTHWGTRDFEHAPKKEKVYRLIANLTRFYREKAKNYLFAGRMIASQPVQCESLLIPNQKDTRPAISIPEILSTAWEDESGKRVQILINPNDGARTCTVGGKSVTVPALDAVMIDF